MKDLTGVSRPVAVNLAREDTAVKNLELRLAIIRTIASVISTFAAIAALALNIASMWYMMNYLI